MDRIGLARAEDIRPRLTDLRVSGDALVGTCPGELGPFAITVRVENDVRTHCGCGGRQVCPHAAALLLTWAATPQRFAAEPLEATLQRLETLVTRVLDEGLAEGRDRIAAELTLTGEQLWGHKVTRLSRCVAALARRMAYRKVAPSGVSYARAIADIHRQCRKILAHYAGDPLPAGAAAALLGLEPDDRAGPLVIELVEYAFDDGMEADDRVFRESRCVDLQSGRHLAERQTVPVLHCLDLPPLVPRDGVRAGRAQMIPGYAPMSVEIEDPTEAELEHAAIEKLLAACLPGVPAALEAYQKAQSDPFAPEALPVAIRIDAIVAHQGRFAAATGKDGVLVSQRTIGQVRTHALAGQVLAILGEIAVESALIVLDAKALVLSADGVLRLVRLKPFAAENEMDAVDRWSATAKAVGIRPAALHLGALRGQVADAAATGLGTAAAAKWAATLQRFGMKKAADLATAIAELVPEVRPTTVDPIRVERWVELLRVVEHALVRASASVEVEPQLAVSALAEVPAPAFVSVADTVSVEALASRFDLWADCRERPHVVARLSERPDLAIPAAKDAIAAWRGRSVLDTALAILEAADPAAVGEIPVPTWTTDPLVPKRTGAARLEEFRRRGAPAEDRNRDVKLLDALASVRDPRRFPSARAACIREIGESGDRRGIPCIRQAWREGRADEIVEAAVVALAALGDTSVLPWIDAEIDAGQRRIAVEAAGRLGELRLAQAVVRTWSTRADDLAQRAIAGFGLTILPLLIQTATDAPRPERFGVFESMPPGPVVSAANAVLAARGDDPVAVSGMLEILARVSPPAHEAAVKQLAHRAIAQDAAVKRAMKPKPKHEEPASATPVPAPVVELPPDRLSAPEFRFGLWFPVGTRVIAEDGQWKAVELAAPLSVRGVAWPRGSILHFEGETVAMVDLPLQAQPFTVGEHAVLAGRWVAAGPSWEPTKIRLPRPQRLGTVRFERDDEVELDHGKPVAVTLGCKRVIDGVPRDAGTRLAL